MDRIEDLNGQRIAINEILRHVVPLKEIFIVSGQTGSGVSWTLNQCANKWREEGGVALIATGNQSATSRNLFPWLTMTMPGTKHLARFEVLKESLSQSSKSIPVVGPVASYFVQEVLNHRKRQLEREAVLLNSQEQDILYVIQSCSRAGRLMLVVDHIDAWDEASWSLLALVISGNLDDLYPALHDALIVIGSSSDNLGKIRKIAQPFLTTEYVITLLPEEEIIAALSEFGFPKLDSVEEAKLFKVTHGRLDLLHDISSHLRLFGFPTMYVGWRELFSELVKRRIEELQKQISDLGEVLIAAAVVGETFGFDDLVCITGAASDTIHKILSLASEEQFVTVESGRNMFVSPELYRYFHDEGVKDHVSYHRKFAECLRLMRPGDYGHRRYHLLRANETDNARVCGVLAVLAARREGRKLPYDLFPDSELEKDDVLNRYLELMLQAFDAFEEQKLTRGLEIIELIESFLPEVLIAERDYLEALLLLASPSVDSYSKARRLLERWTSLEGTEGELWSRIAQNLMMAQAQTGQIDQALKSEKDLTAFYWKRRQTDPWALYGLNVLRRRAECIHALPTSTERLENALLFFGSSEIADVMPRHPIQFYKTLTNLVGNLLASGRFEDAALRASILETLIKQHTRIPWPSPEIAANNSILAYFLAGTLAPETATALLQQVAAESFEAGDHILIQNNLAVLLVHSGRSDEARTVLETAYESITSCEKPDIYHLYFVCNNLSAIHLIKGQLDQADKFIQICNQDIDQFYPAIQATIRRRQELLKEVLTEVPGLTVNQFDSLLIQRFGMQVGPQWKFYGRGFLATDIQFWSVD